MKTFDRTISALSHSRFLSLATSTTSRVFSNGKQTFLTNLDDPPPDATRISGPPSAILAMRLSHPLHGSLLPPGICYTCDVCGKTLSTKLTLKRHKEQQHFQPLNSAVCALCHKVFRTLNSLNNHKSIYHRRQK